MSIGEVARRSGLAASALRHDEAEGLLSTSRDEVGRRVYRRSTLRRVAFIRAAQAVGLSLAEVADAFRQLPAERVPTKEDWARVARGWESRLDQQIEALIMVKKGLTSCIGCGCLSLDTCQLTNPGDISSTYGAGAQYLPAQLRSARRRPSSGRPRS